jgi:hypothetical protein
MWILDTVQGILVVEESSLTTAVLGFILLLLLAHHLQATAFPVDGGLPLFWLCRGSFAGGILSVSA